MENFFYNDRFHDDLWSLMEDMEIDEDVIIDLPDDWLVECNESILETIVVLSAGYIVGHIDEERFSEDGDEMESVLKVLNDNIDFDKINTLMPKMYYETRKKFTVTKNDLIAYCNPQPKD